jgi:hypothetical protein
MDEFADRGGWGCMKKSSTGIMLTLATFALAIAVSLPAYAQVEASRRGGNPVPQKSVQMVLEENNHALLSLPGVVGTAEGLTDNKPCVVVYVTAESQELIRQIPKEIDGYPVIIEETGQIHTLPEHRERRE